MSSSDATIDCVCVTCGKRVASPRQPYDYPEAVKMVLKCPDCWDGDFDEPSYFDASGAPVEYDPDLIPRAPLTVPR